MNENIADLVYATRNLCELLRDRPDYLDSEDEMRDIVSDIEELLDKIGEVE